MAQNWQIIAPELKKRFNFNWDSGLKLREIFYDGAAESIIIHLASPTAQRIEEMLSPIPSY
jgi:hypothetical protein